MCLDASAAMAESAMTTAGEDFRYFSRPVRIGYTIRRLWSVLPARWMPVSLSANGGCEGE